jgi:tetracycline resistance efflux pump
MENTWWSLLPPIVAIFFAIKTRQVILSLLIGVFLGAFILAEGNLLLGLSNGAEIIVDMFKDPSNTRNIIFSLLIGALIQLVQHFKGVEGFVEFITSRNVIKSARQAGFIAAFLSAILFIESNISILTAGTVFKDIFKKFKMSMVKLAYIVDSTCAPVKVLIPLNAWGAYILAQLKAGGVENNFDVFLSSMKFFYYPMVAVLLVLITIFFNFNLSKGGMKKFEEEAQLLADSEQKDQQKSNASALVFLVPMFVLIFSSIIIMFTMWYQSGGDFKNINSSAAILYAVILAVIVAAIMVKSKTKTSLNEIMEQIFKGIYNLFEIALILLLAFAINAITQKLQTGIFVAHLMDGQIPLMFIPVLIFILSCFISFATGTSWGTFAIMLSIGIPIANTLHLDLPLIVGAVIAGGVWGDHCSPISDTTVMSSVAVQCKHIDHVNTQLPYALLGGAISIILFAISGYIIL